MPNSVVVGELRAVYPDHINLGGNLRILLRGDLSMDGLGRPRYGGLPAPASGSVVSTG
jgi:hypothetical protein